MLPNSHDYATLRRNFRWNIPLYYNIGVDVCDRWAAADPERVAILWERPDSVVESVTYGRLRDASNRLANALRVKGIKAGDRVALVLAQGPAAAISHIAIYKLGAIAVPLATLFGIDSMQFRLADSGAKALITNAQGLEKLDKMGDTLPDLKLVFSVDGPTDRAEGFYQTLEQASPASNRWRPWPMTRP